MGLATKGTSFWKSENTPFQVIVSYGPHWGASSYMPAITQAISAVAQTLCETIFVPITFYMECDIGYIGNNPMNAGSLGESNSLAVATTYAAVKAGMTRNAVTHSARTMVANLPSTDPATEAWYWNAVHGKAYGAYPARQPTQGLLDANMGFSSSAQFFCGSPIAGYYDAYGVCLHEWTECLGRLGYGGIAAGGLWEPADLFRYSSAGNFSTTSPGGYCSIDGGVTNLFNYTTDGSQDAMDTTETDASWAAVANSGVNNIYTPNERIMFDALGYSAASWNR
jgi:hypothetical protein